MFFVSTHKKNAKIVQKNNNVSSKTESKVGSRKKFHIENIFFKKYVDFSSNFMIFIAEAYFFDIKYTCIYHHR